MRKTQAELDQAYRKRQLAHGIVRKTIRVPLDRWPELMEVAADMRREAMSQLDDFSPRGTE
tara:strand:+ start:496 stop:678 length:183 start_codon:yes stop_codon:yes gene_type:complete